MNKVLLHSLLEMRNVEKANNQPFKVRAYNNVIKQLTAYTEPINSIEDVHKAKFTGIGKGIEEKIKEILATGSTKVIDNNRALAQAVENLCTVHGIGVVKANDLVKTHAIMNVEQLKDRKDLLNDVQLKGLKYHGDIIKRIPRAEMDKHLIYLKKYIKHVQFEIAGSYRRGLPNSGDIDVIMKECPSKSNCYKDAIKDLVESKYIVDILAFGDHKFMGICKLPRHKTFRRIDIMIMDPARYPFALLYFTGSQNHNIWMRNKALAQGYSLNEYGLSKLNSKKLIDMKETIKNERDIYDFLKLDYIEPMKR